MIVRFRDETAFAAHGEGFWLRFFGFVWVRLRSATFVPTFQNWVISGNGAGPFSIHSLVKEHASIAPKRVRV
jgi:hypothetical protein